MATLKILRCRKCMRPLPEGTLTCPKCGTVHKQQQQETVNPLQLTKEVANDYIDFFKHQTESNPKDTNALFGMGLVYMGLKNYELAQRNFQLAVDQSPLEPDVYYYFALSLFEGHNPKNLDPKTADRIEEWLHTASNRQEKRKYLILLMVLRQCAFAAKGMQFKGESPLELMEKIRKIMPEQDDVKEIRDHMKITDKQALEWLDEIQSGERKHESSDARSERYWATQYEYPGPWPANRQQADGYLSARSADPDYGEWLCNEQTRQNFFNYMYEPNEPVKLQKPSLPFGTLIKHLILAPIGMLIVLIIVDIAGFGFKEKDVSPVMTVQEEYQELYGNKRESKAAKKNHMEELFNDSIVRAAEDSAFLADHIMISYEKKDSEGEKKVTWLKKPTEEERGEITGLNGLEKSWHGLVAILLVLLPFFYGLLRVLIAFGRVGKERKQISEENKRRQDEYEYAMYMFNEGRPSIADYVNFCQHYLNKDSDVLPFTGDPVGKALQDNRIDELDMKGKILFLNYFDDKDDNDNTSDMPDDVLNRIYYVIAIPQVDKLTILYNFWDTASNEITSCDAENIYYKNILGVTKKSDGIVIEKVGGTVTTIVFPPNGQKSVLTYQDQFNEFPTFSNTRTADPQAFLDALNALVAAFK